MKKRPITAASGPVRPPTVARDLTAMVLPATGTDSRPAPGLDGFAQLVGHTRLQARAERAGVQPPEVPPLAYIGWSDLPDPGFVGRHGLRMSVPALPSASPSGRAAGWTDRAAQQRCETEGRAARRTAFEAAHRDELRALERGLLPRIRELEHRHGLTFGHPVP
ncbi:hypothetical protein AB0F25_25630 [Streptomyces wedmorensis]|uniref:hypothetical protein n=1 Tax=Streptomyces wedmorensis TaxID=43759 RepID=UPI00342BBF99